MIMQLIHGRHAPDEQLSDWGFDGPRLIDITGYHWTYGTLQVIFKDEASMAVAQALTGWAEGVCEFALEVFEPYLPLEIGGMKSKYDLIQALDKAGEVAYYGDYDIIEDDEFLAPADLESIVDLIGDAIDWIEDKPFQNDDYTKADLMVMKVQVRLAKKLQARIQKHLKEGK